jgi:hypothetical protein
LDVVGLEVFAQQTPLVLIESAPPVETVPPQTALFVVMDDTVEVDTATLLPVPAGASTFFVQDAKKKNVQMQNPKMYFISIVFNYHD